MKTRLPALLAALLILTSVPSRAQDTAEDYRAQWERGAYARACRTLEERLGDDVEFSPLSLRLDYADLLFEVGRVDDAIAILNGVVSDRPSPVYTLRLALLYRYRGRWEDYGEALVDAEMQAQRLLRYRVDREEWLALGRLMELKGEDPKRVLGHYGRLAEEFPDYAPGFVAAGDLAYRVRAYDVAARRYGRALEIAPRSQDALAGLAGCYYRSGDARMQEAVARLLSINPNHPRARTLQAEQLLDLGDAEGAAGVLEEVLSINPNHLRALSLKAALFFLQDRPAAAETVRQQALALNPRCSDVYRLPGRIASRHYRFEAGRAFQERALEIDPDDNEARLLLAFDLLRLGRDAAARRELEAVFEADPYNVRAYNLLEVSDSIAKFKTVERGIFRIQLPEMEAQILSDDMLTLLEEAASVYQEKYRIHLHTPVYVQMFDDHDEFMVRSVGLPGNAGHLGICFGRLVTLDSPGARRPGSTNWRQVLWHEFVHVITLQKTANRMPRWLSEGISVYEETQVDAAWGQKMLPDFKRIVDAGPSPGVEDLERYFTRPESPTHLLYGYFAAGEFVRSYVDAYGTDALVASLHRIGEGEGALKALSAAGGDPPARMEARFRRHMEARCAPLANLPGLTAAPDGAARPWTHASSPFTEALRQGENAAKAGDLEGAEAAYLSAHALYPDYTADDAPLRRIARLYGANGDREKHAAVLGRIVAWDGTAYGECLELAALLAEDEMWDGAAAALDRAAGIVPFHVPMLRDRLHVLIRKGDLSRAAEEARKLIVLDAPRRAEHRLELAEVLAQKGDLPAAKAEVIALLEEMPHFWDAQKLLLEIVDQGGNP